MNKKMVGWSVVALAVMGDVSVSNAAIDDDGMKYVSAAEGLSGSLRVKIVDDDNEEAHNNARTSVLDASRLVYKGENRVHADMLATYYIELRASTSAVPNSANRVLQSRYLDVGVKGFFGHFRFGEIESISSAIIPSADRSGDIGTTGDSKLAQDYTGMRWLSPEVGGLMFGFSGEVEDSPIRVDVAARGDQFFDKYDAAFVYRVPVVSGLAFGASYAISRPGLLEIDRLEDGIEIDDAKGYRVGVVYEHSGWGFGYNFHKYTGSSEGLNDYIGTLRQGTGQDRKILNSNMFASNKNGKVQEHIIGANVLFGRLGFALNYGIIKGENEKVNTSADGDHLDFSIVDKRADITYNMSSKAKLIAAYSILDAKGDNLSHSSEVSKRRTEYYVLMRVDF